MRFLLTWLGSCAWLVLSAQWLSLDGGASHQVRAFAVDEVNDRLLIAGGFPFVQGGALRANNMAWWDGSAWDTTGLGNGNGNMSEYGVVLPIFSTVVRADTVFAGHGYVIWHESREMAYSSMLVDGQWSPCGNPDGLFYFLEAEGRLFSGGVHDSLNGVFSPGIHEWGVDGFRDMPNMPFTDRVQVNDVAYWQGKYYFGGLFDVFNSPRIVAFDGGDQWEGVGEGVGGYFIETVCGYGDSLYVAGWMAPGPNVQSRHIQLWDGAAWLPFFPQVEFYGVVRDMQVHDGALYISGIHTWEGDDTWYGLLRYDGHELCSIGGPMPSGDNSKMAFFHDELYLGLGYSFTGLEAQYVGRLPLLGLVPDRCVAIAATGVSEQRASDALLNVYPNPATDQLSVSMPGLRSATVLRLFDATGRVVLSAPLRSPEQQVDIAGLPPGSYALRVDGGPQARVVIMR